MFNQTVYRSFNTETLTLNYIFIEKINGNSNKTNFEK